MGKTKVHLAYSFCCLKCLVSDRHALVPEKMSKALAMGTSHRRANTLSPTLLLICAFVSLLSQLFVCLFDFSLLNFHFSFLSFFSPFFLLEALQISPLNIKYCDNSLRRMVVL